MLACFVWCCITASLIFYNNIYQTRWWCWWYFTKLLPTLNCTWLWFVRYNMVVVKAWSYMRAVARWLRLKLNFFHETLILPIFIEESSHSSFAKINVCNQQASCWPDVYSFPPCIPIEYALINYILPGHTIHRSAESKLHFHQLYNISIQYTSSKFEKTLFFCWPSNFTNRVFIISSFNVQFFGMYTFKEQAVPYVPYIIKTIIMYGEGRWMMNATSNTYIFVNLTLIRPFEKL